MKEKILKFWEYTQTEEYKRRSNLAFEINRFSELVKQLRKKREILEHRIAIAQYNIEADEEELRMVSETLPSYEEQLGYLEKEYKVLENEK